MGKYILKRLLYVIPTLFIISILIFITIQLPPGDYVTNMLEQMRNQTARRPLGRQNLKQPCAIAMG